MYCYISKNGKTLAKSRLAVEARENVNYTELLSLCLRKQVDFNPDLVPSNDINHYELLYRSKVSAQAVPGSDDAFTLFGYKAACGMPYSNISFLLNYHATPGTASLLFQTIPWVCELLLLQLFVIVGIIIVVFSQQIPCVMRYHIPSIKLQSLITTQNNLRFN